MRTSLGECGRRPRHRPRRRPLVADLQLAQPLPQLVALLLAFFLFLPFRLIASSELIEELGIHLHESLEHIVDERHYGLVPVLLADPVQRGEHYRHYHVVVFFHQ